MRELHRSQVNSPHKSQWLGDLMFSLLCAMNQRLSKQSRGWWFKTPSCQWWRHCNDNVLANYFAVHSSNRFQTTWIYIQIVSITFLFMICHSMKNTWSLNLVTIWYLSWALTHRWQVTRTNDLSFIGTKFSESQCNPFFWFFKIVCKILTIWCMSPYDTLFRQRWYWR